MRAVEYFAMYDAQITSKNKEEAWCDSDKYGLRSGMAFKTSEPHICGRAARTTVAYYQPAWTIHGYVL